MSDDIFYLDDDDVLDEEWDERTEEDYKDVTQNRYQRHRDEWSG